MEKISLHCKNEFSSNLLLRVTITWLSGSTLAFFYPSQSPPSFFPFATVAVSLLCALPVLYFRHNLIAPACLALFFCTGYLQTNFALHQPYQSNHIGNMVTQKTRATVVGTIATMLETDHGSCRFNLDLEEILIQEQAAGPSSFRRTTGTIRLKTFSPCEKDLEPGRKIMTLASLSPIRSYQTPGAFDYALHMATKGIYINGWIKSSQHIVRLHTDAPPWRTPIRCRLESLRQYTSNFLQNNLSPSNAALYEALLIGYRKNLPLSLIEQFQNSGLMHLLAVSGIHLTLLGSMAAYLFIQCGKRSDRILLYTRLPVLSAGITIPILGIYSVLAGLNTPVQRAFTMASLAVYTLVTGRRKQLLNLLAATAMFVLFLNPLLPASASFQLSFAAVLSIIVISPQLNDFLSPNADKKKSLRLFRIPLSLTAVSFAAAMGTLPILLYHFNRVSVIGPVMNLIMEPLLCFWALPLGLTAIPLSFLFPDAAAALLHLGGLGLSLAQYLVESAALIPHSSIHTITPYPYEIALYYIIFLSVIYPAGIHLRLPLALFAGLILTISIFLSLHPPLDNNQSAVHILDIGQGNATVLQLPDGKNVLLDGGGSQSPRFDTGRSVIAPFLWKQRIRRLDAVIISHPDADHYNGIPYILEHFSPTTLYINGMIGDTASAYKNILHLAGDLNITIHHPSPGSVIASAENFELKCLGTQPSREKKTTPSTNDRSLVLLLKHGNRSFLFPGDISTAAEALVVESNPALKADILLTAHHGSITSSSAPFLQSVEPNQLLISSNRRIDKNNLYHADMDDYLKQTGATVLATAVDGTISYLTDGENLHVRTHAVH